jgi:hypothetical protein
MFSKNTHYINPKSILIAEPSTISSNTIETELVDEWSVVPKFEAKYAISIDTENNNNIQHDVGSSPSTSSNLINFNNVYDEFLKLYLTNEFLNQVEPSKLNSNFLHKIVTNLFGPEKLRKEYIQNRDFIYLLATKQIDESCLLHTQILVSLYRKITGTLIDCPRYGTHWESIGFQGKHFLMISLFKNQKNLILGTDPATDLRGCGVLSLLLTLYLFEDSILHKLTIDIYKLSLNEAQNFPFFVMGINLIRILLQIMHTNQLNNYFNKSNGKIIDICGKFYAALYLELYLQWKNNFKTIKDSGFVLRDIELKAKKSPKYFLNKLNKYIKKEQEMSKKQISNKFANLPKIVIQKAESSEQDFTRLDF